MLDQTADPSSPGDIGKEIPLWMAIMPILVLILLLTANVYFYREDSSYGPNQIALLVAAATAAAVGYLLGVPIRKMIAGVQTSIGSAVVAMLILLLIGSLTGTWMMSGIVPAMIYYGLGILNAEIFLFAAAIICAVVSVVTGSSWSTVATVGIALLGIGTALGIYEGLIAGAIISGAYFGDKISPLSDTTNLAAAMAGTDLMTHIRYMLWTTVPSFLITLGIFWTLGFSIETQEIIQSNDAIKNEIATRFNLNPIMFVVPLAVLIMVVMKADALVALFVGAVGGGIVAIVMQPGIVKEISGLQDVPVKVVDSEGNETTEMRPRSYFEHSYVAFVNSMSVETTLIDQERVDELKKLPPDQQSEQIKAEIAAADLLKGKGMAGMLNTIWLILAAMCFGGVMEGCGLLRRMTQPLVKFAQSTGALVTTTAGSCLFVNFTASDQYLAIVVPGRMFRETYRDRGLAPQNLSRTLEDAGTVTSVLIPWNTCGATQQGVLGVEVMTFAPYCFFNYISPLMTVLFAWSGIRIARLPDKSNQPDESRELHSSASGNDGIGA